jgi:ABC-2 type transport system permease protein
MRYKENYIAFQTILIKEVTRFTRIWTQSILPSAITTVLYFVIFGHVIGSQIRSIDGFSYMQYIAPGLIMMSIITNAYSNVASSVYGLRFSKSIEELLVSPMPNWLILLGFVLGGVARGLAVGLVVTILSLFFTKLQLTHVMATFAIVILTATLFSLAGFTNAILAKTFDDISIIPTFVLTPLTYLGGVFYSVNLLPDVWRTISFGNPILYMVDTFRYGILGVSDLNVSWAFGLITLLIVILFSTNLYLLNKGVGIRT